LSVRSSVKQKAYTSYLRYEGAIGEDLDLRELQQSGRIGRIKVDLHSEAGKSHGTIVIPCSLDRTETAILAAALETVDRVGPCAAKITLEKLEDVREEKRRRIIDRAVDLLRVWEGEVSPDSQEVTDMVVRESRTAGITKYGSEALPAGPAVDESDTIIIVEGRADVLALLRAGIKNAVAVEGTSVPKSISDWTKNKTVIAFLDGDRGGDLILKELGQVAKIDFVARAPTGREVEELSQKEIIKALRSKMPAAQVMEQVKRKVPPEAASAIPARRGARRPAPLKVKPSRRGPSLKVVPTKAMPVKKPIAEIAKPKQFVVPEPVREAAQRIQQTMMALVLDKDFKKLKETHVAEVATDLQSIEHGGTVILDGVVTQRLVDIAEERGVDLIVGARIGNIVKKPARMRIHTFDDL
jgi:DNA primase